MISLMQVAHKIWDLVDLLHRLEFVYRICKHVSDTIRTAFASFSWSLIAPVIKAVDTTIKIGLLVLCAGGIFLIYRYSSRPSAQ